MCRQTLKEVWKLFLARPFRALQRDLPHHRKQDTRITDLPNTQFAAIQEGMHISVSLGDMCIQLGSAASRAGDS